MFIDSLVKCLWMLFSTISSSLNMNYSSLNDDGLEIKGA